MPGVKMRITRAALLIISTVLTDETTKRSSRRVSRKQRVPQTSSSICTHRAMLGISSRVLDCDVRAVLMQPRLKHAASHVLKNRLLTEMKTFRTKKPVVLLLRTKNTARLAATMMEQIWYGKMNLMILAERQRSLQADCNHLSIPYLYILSLMRLRLRD
jgi:hypothetical protein